MAYGRIRRNRAKVRKAATRQTEKSYEKRVNVVVGLTRVSSQYDARACVTAGKKRLLGRSPMRAYKSGSQSCAYARGRTPQAATAKALKRLSSKVARRGRKNRR